MSNEGRLRIFSCGNKKLPNKWRAKTHTAEVIYINAFYNRKRKKNLTRNRLPPRDPTQMLNHTNLKKKTKRENKCGSGNAQFHKKFDVILTVHRR